MLFQGAAERDKNQKASADAKAALKNLLRSGIPGVEAMFAPKESNNASGGKRKAGKLSCESNWRFHIGMTNGRLGNK